jgi:hypothetical protein
MNNNRKSRIVEYVLAKEREEMGEAFVEEWKAAGTQKRRERVQGTVLSQCVS